ncbi:MAG: flagellar biosynthesis anti-sigma factor FlgM [Selenomonadaceae bacterium]|nr:flagellar biosynthesis anti-sigma factor FlgM [Selenomonadaceae bacterium]
MIVNNVGSSSKYYSNSVTANRYANAASYVRGTQKTDAFTPSQQAQSFSEMLNKLKNTSEVRQDRVNELQQRIASGQYSVSSSDIALSLLSSRY